MHERAAIIRRIKLHFFLICGTYLWSCSGICTDIHYCILTNLIALGIIFVRGFILGLVKVIMTKTSVQRKCKAYKIYTQLLERLENNFYSVHTPIPAVSVLAEEFGVSVGTADHALQLLAAEGKVIRKIGSGTYPAQFVRRPRIACFLTDMPTKNQLDNWSHCWIYTQTVIKILQKMDCEFKVFSYCDLLQAHFSPRFLKNFDILITGKGFCDDNSRKMIYDFKGNIFLVDEIFPVCTSACQVIPDFVPAISELLKKARNADVKKLCFYYHKKEYKEIFDTALLITDWDKVQCEFIPLNRCSMLDAYRIGQNIQADRSILYICSADIIAAGFYQAFIDRGLSPGEFAISGVGNNEDFGFLPFEGKHLTTISIDTSADIYKMIQLLFESLKSGSKIAHLFRAPVSVVYRDSTFF